MHICSSFYSHDDVTSSIARRREALQAATKLYESPTPGVYVVEARTGAGIFDELFFCLIVEGSGRYDALIHGGVPIGMVVLTPPPVFKNIDTIRPPSYVKTPHCGIVREHARRGIMSGMYRRLLNDGHFFVTGGRQTPTAERLWLKLSKEFELNCVDRKYGTPTQYKEPGQWLYTLHDPRLFTVQSLLQPDFSTAPTRVSL